MNVVLEDCRGAFLACRNCLPDREVAQKAADLPGKPSTRSRPEANEAIDLIGGEITSINARKSCEDCANSTELALHVGETGCGSIKVDEKGLHGSPHHFFV